MWRGTGLIKTSFPAVIIVIILLLKEMMMMMKVIGVSQKECNGIPQGDLWPTALSYNRNVSCAQIWESTENHFKVFSWDTSRNVSTYWPRLHLFWEIICFKTSLNENRKLIGERRSFKTYRLSPLKWRL